MTDRIKRRLLEILAACVLASAVAACDDTMARRDAIRPWSGDDVAANAAIQTVNPWPDVAFRQRATMQGSKAEDAMKLYRAPPPPPAAAPSTTDVAAPAASPGGGASAPPTTE